MVTAILDALRKHYPKETNLSLREHRSSISGLYKSELRGSHGRRGLTLEIKHEFLEIQRDGPLHKNYRYRIMRGQDELIRFQTDRTFPENAHFPPLFEQEHFVIAKWPTDLQDMNFLTVFKFFLELVRTNGELPELFRSARP